VVWGREEFFGIGDEVYDKIGVFELCKLGNESLAD
jgi:hypothetical protein